VTEKAPIATGPPDVVRDAATSRPFPAVAQLGRQLLDLLLPPTCGGCGQVGALYCAKCYRQSPWLAPPLCPTCGRKVSPATWGGPDNPRRCRACAGQSTHLRRIRAAVGYAQPVDRAIKKMKYDGYFALAEPLADLMAAAWPRYEMDVDLVIPIPLHHRRFRERGFNQSALLARRFGHRSDLPVAETALMRVRHTRPQVGLGAPRPPPWPAGACFWSTMCAPQGPRCRPLPRLWSRPGPPP
jgi:predicted amidophosphoribosyltransferase